MKKLALVLLILIPFGVHSQSTCLKIKLGPAIPLGNYGVVNYESSAYAKPGGNFSFSAEWKFNKYLGIKGSFSYTFNPVDADQIALDYNTWRPNMTHIVQSGNYTIYSFMGGLVVSIPIKEFLSLDLYGLIGYSITGDPGKRIEGSAKSSFDYHRFETYSANAGSLCFQAGTDIYFKLTDRFELGIGLGYFGTQPKFRDVGLVIEEYLITEIGTEVSTTDWNYNVHILNVDVGLKVALGK